MTDAVKVNASNVVTIQSKLMAPTQTTDWHLLPRGFEESSFGLVSGEARLSPSLWRQSLSSSAGQNQVSSAVPIIAYYLAVALR